MPWQSVLQKHLPLGEVSPKGAERAVSFADSSPIGGAKAVKNLSLRTSDRCHYSALRAAFGGCALYAPAGAVVWQSVLLNETFRKSTG